MSRKILPTTVKRIIQLRQKGLSLSEIKKQVKVSSGSVFGYAKGVQVLPQYRQSWISKRGGSLKRKIIAEKNASSKAKKIVTSLSQKEKIVLLSALYWAEGNKKDFILTNTDPNLIKVFTKGLVEIFKIPKENLKVSIRIYEDLNRDNCLDFWSKIVNIELDQSTSINVLRGKKDGKLPYGMCRIRIKRGGDMLKYITALKEEIVKLF